MQTILITGGTGLVGRQLASQLAQQDYHVIILTRKKPEGQLPANINYALWDIRKKTIEDWALLQADHIIHLAGAGVMDKKWTEAYKQEIIDSRVESAALILNKLKALPHHVSSFISASAIGYYGPDKPGQKPFEEAAVADTHFLGEVCRLWEESVEPATALGIRLVKLRIGIVLSDKGGALKEFITPLKFGIATVLGNGRQMVSWIHIDDLCELFLFAVKNDSMQAVYNAVAPHPISNRTLVTTLAKIRNGKWFLRIPVPQFILKIILGGRSIEVLKSATVSSKKTAASGFQFQFENIEAALTNILKKN